MTGGGAADLTVLESVDAVAWEAASRIVAAARRAVDERGRFTLALSGGSTPLRLFALLALAEWQVRMPWAQTVLFWVDERCVPPDHPDSNAGETERTLLARLVTPPAAVHRWLGEAADPVAEGQRYAAVLRAELLLDPLGIPVLDMVTLGMGADGHTASLFPATAALNEEGTPAVANFVPAQAVWRLTLTMPVLRAARDALMLVTGEEKAATLAAALSGSEDAAELPVRRLAAGRERLSWLVDAAAASRLGS